jgi:transposase
MDRNGILAAYHQGPEAVINLFVEIHTKQELRIHELETRNKQLEETIQKLKTHIQELEANRKKNSTNSHKPPSTDGFQKPITRSLRGKTGRLTGGQPGHQGRTLQAVKQPDSIVVHQILRCTCCHTSLKKEPVIGTRKRQVFDLPATKIEVTQHEVEAKVCPHCLAFQEADFPKDVNQFVQYGSRIQALAVYLINYQMLSYSRTAAFFRDQFGQSISEGTLVNMNRTFGKRLPLLEQQLREEILQSPVVHFDETGIRTNGQLQWLHTMSTKDVTLQYVHPKRGKEAMDHIGILPAFSHIAVHDGWNSYFKYEQCRHVLCNAHLLRELQGIYDQTKEEWAQEMIELLRSAKVEKDRSNGRVDVSVLIRIEQAYERILQKGYQLHPDQIEPNPSRGRPKQHPSKNLLDRFTRDRDAILAFLTHEDIPFDNNQAERDIRMAKVKQKVSGSFRSEDGASLFSLTRSLIHTAQKQGKPIFHSIEKLIREGKADLFS